MAAATVVAPSPFAVLFRHSKFASYDPAIKQVYTTYGGDAHRGNWGLKRPLALRRRQAFITVKSIDSPEQQTEWDNGENQARFIRRWDELGVDARYSETSPWVKRVGTQSICQWQIDSEFAPVSDQASNRIGSGSQAIPNIHAMSPKQFERYLEKLRKLRPAFKEYIAKLGETDPRVRGKTLFELGQNPEADYHKRFIAEYTAQQYASRESRAIEQMPHQTGGLSYTHTTPLETLFTTKSQPGFVLQRSTNRTAITRRGSTYMQDSYLAGFAGRLAQMRRRDAGGKVPLLEVTSEEGIKLDRIADSITNMRILTLPRLGRGPHVVGSAAEGIEAVQIDMEVTSEDKSDFSRSNPHPPGSREYNAQPPPQLRQNNGRTTPMAYVVKQRRTRQSPEKLLETLRRATPGSA